MSNEKEEKGKEEKEVTEAPKAEEGFTNIVERFTGIVKKFKIKNAELVSDHCAKGELEDLEDVEARMREMGVHPSLVTQVVNFWADEIHHPIPKRLRKKMERETGIKTKESKEEEADEKYTVDSVSGVIRLAKENERAVTLDEAMRLQKLVKKDLAELEERELGGKKEPAFILGEGGAWTLNPKSKIGFGEFAVFQMYQDSLKKGEPIDPVEELTKREEQSIRLKEAMGVKGKDEDTELTLLDKLDRLGMLKKTEGGGTLEMLQVLGELGVIKKTGEEGRTSELDLIAKLGDLGFLRKPGEERGTSELDLIAKLSELGVIKKAGEEGRASELDLMAKLSDLGFLRKPGEGESATTQTMHALEAQVKELMDSLRKQEMDTVKSAVVSLSNQLGELRKEMTTQGRLEGRYALMQQAMTSIDNQLTGLRGDVKPVLMAAGGGGGHEPKIRTPEEKARVAKGLKEAVVLEKRARELEDKLLFGVRES